MGRPIKKKFFGNLITPFQNHATGGRTGVGGEGMLSVIAVATSGTLYSAGATLVVSSPDISGGIRATATPTISLPGLGGITAVTLETVGTGYNSTATITATTATGVAKVTTGTSATNIIYPATTTGIYVGMKVIGTGINAGSTYVSTIYSTGTVLSAANASTVTGTVSFIDVGSGFSALTGVTSRQDAISFISYLTTGSNSVVGGDILKQESSRRYLVQNAQGQGQCKLITTSTLTAGTMNIIATDWNGSTYFVNKLTAHRAIVVRSTASTAFLVLDGASTGWTLGAATGTIVTIAHTL